MLSENSAKEIKVEIVPLTLDIAKHYNRMKTLKGDRDPDTPKGRHRIAWLYSLLRAGLFHSPEWSDVELRPINKKEKPKTFRVDGGGSSRMLVHAGPDFPENLHVSIRHFLAETMEEVLELYEQFNPKSSTRTKADLIKNRIAYIPELEELSPSNVSYIVTGIAFHLKAHDNTEDYIPLDLIRPYSEFIAWCSEFVFCRKLIKPGVMGAIYNTYIHNRIKALDFWMKVRDDTGATPICPTRFLSKFLNECIFTRGRYKNNVDRKWSQEAYYVKCHHAWNAWIRGDTTNLKYKRRAPLPNLL